MRLKRLEIQGFKTFAQKTIFVFLEPQDGSSGLTVIVGPNGSGKSNAADAIRWVMGEQSLRLLRGRASEDVIFSGSATKPRSGLAEVSLVLENNDHPDIAFSEIVLTRRLDRDGHSVYEINGEQAKLSDVSLLLAQIGIAQRSYAVIGQGMVDQVLTASPSERKAFFDEAFGLRPFHLRREQALRKMDEARGNLEKSQLLLRELEPRVQTLRKQVERFQEKEQLQARLREMEECWYGAEWRRLRREAARVEQEVRIVTDEERRLEERLQKIPVLTEEKSVPGTDVAWEAQQELQKLQEQRMALHERRSALETKQAVAAAKTERPWSPLPLSKIVERLQILQREGNFLTSGIDSLDPKELVARLRGFTDSLGRLLADLERPAPDTVTSSADPALLAELESVREMERSLFTQIQHIESNVATYRAQDQAKRQAWVEQERARTQLERERFAIERRRSEQAVALARVEERRATLLEDVNRLVPELHDRLDVLAEQAGDAVDPGLPNMIQRLRTQIEWAGAIDPAITAEYDETQTRLITLQAQASDIEKSLAELEAVVLELDATILEKRTTAFDALNTAFGSATRELFGGGEAGLVDVRAESEMDPETGEVITSSEEVVGIEIFATPPGKRLKAVSLLSGGERALISIALICAIMATNPSPFVVLDEVDAALDESNARKFGEMLAKMSKQTQFIVVTHNRATMVHANAIYGVTMEEGISKVLSMKLEN
ncbi:AAA family ATPase [Patescibacteria group bacterium]|nr:AAA family ATPase [Patescibacteria group bacterium]